MLKYDGEEYNLSCLFQWELLSKLLTSMAKRQNEITNIIKNGGIKVNQNVSDTNFESLLGKDDVQDIDLPDSYGKELKEKLKNIDKKLKNMNIL